MIVLIGMGNTIANAQKKYENSIEFGGMFELGNDILQMNDVSALSLTYIGGCKLGDYFFIGGGIGIDYSLWDELGYSSIRSEYSVSMPLYLRTKVNFTAHKFSPYCSLDFGYNFMLGSSEDYLFEGIHNEWSYKRSGFIFSPTIGIDFKLENENNLYLGFSYMLNLFAQNERSYSYYYNSLGFKVGVGF